ncbi:PAS domain S-box-containing protein [Bacillus mesophilus]|uniref:PAS domain-containing protein n=1 Tax=Bacillus mesophilus TaxID=1808955 RepID=A0A6M0QAN8_9BACI|nr:PAS domain S-box protein [Bacillus mesophilus]MBM7662024.1 PAS domain S-box-containing protein [Bacillus mesophilus]NEY72620.1 PAS domain-containing protein [Bacillus mesophilus]
MEHNHYYNDLTEESLISQYIYQDGQFNYVNPAFSNLFGYNREELLSNKIKLENLLLPESYSLALEVGIAFAQSEKPF